MKRLIQSIISLGLVVGVLALYIPQAFSVIQNVTVIDSQGEPVRTQTVTIVFPAGVTDADGNSEVQEETVRLQADWKKSETPQGGTHSLLEEILPKTKLERLDPFDRAQLAEVLRVCRSSKNLSEAGRQLFSVSRRAKKTPNDADRLRKYLAKFGLVWGDVAAE